MDHLAYDNVESDIVSITFREGMTQRQIGELLEENKVCTAQEFYDALEEGDYSSYNFAGLVPDEELRFRKYEGYIFPDTYEFYTNMNPEGSSEEILQQLRQQGGQRSDEGYPQSFRWFGRIG